MLSEELICLPTVAMLYESLSSNKCTWNIIS
jgi:hypothetical protein